MQEVVGFIPAAGVGSRMNGFPIMKEMLPMPASVSKDKKTSILIDNPYVNRYECKVRFILARIYRNRNKIVHSGRTNHYQIQLYNKFLGFSARTLLQSVIGGITVSDVTEDIGKKLLNTTISSNYNTWFYDFI